MRFVFKSTPLELQPSIFSSSALQLLRNSFAVLFYGSLQGSALILSCDSGRLGFTRSSQLEVHFWCVSNMSASPAEVRGYLEGAVALALKKGTLMIRRVLFRKLGSNRVLLAWIRGQIAHIRFAWIHDKYTSR